MEKQKFFNFSKIIWFLFYLVIFFYLLFNSFSYLDPDLGWHLRVGEEVAKERSVPNIESYTYTLEGDRWVDHEWLLDTFSFLVYKNGGYLSLNIFFAVLAILPLIISTIFIKKYIIKTGGNFLIMAMQFWGILAMAPHLGVRMQEITLLNLLFLLIILECFNRRKNYKTILWLFPLFFFWANVHAGFLIGIFIIFFFFAVKTIEIFIKKYKFFSFFESKYIFTKKELLYTLTIFILIPLITLFTPYGLKLYSFLGGYTNTYYLTHIAEWLPAFYWPISYMQMAYSAILISFVALSILKINGNVITKKESEFKFDLWKLALFLLFLLLSLKSRRHFPLYFFASFFLLIQCMRFNLFIPEHISKIFKNILIQTYTVIMLICISTLLIFNTKFTNEPFSSTYFCQKYPCNAINFIKKNEQYNNLKIFNSYSWGGFMSWVWPEKKLFIDGRMPQHCYASHTMLEEYREFFEEGKAETKLNEHNIKIVLLSLTKPLKLSWFDKYVLGLNEQKENDKKNNLKEFLDNSKNWKLLYSDNISNVFIKQK